MGLLAPGRLATFRLLTLVTTTWSPPMLLKTRKALRMTWPIDRLSLHPKQKQYFAAHTRERIVDLAQDIRANGLQERIEVTPKGRILSGWGRFLAVQELGWTEVPVLVRHDLVAKGTNLRR